LPVLRVQYYVRRGKRKGQKGIKGNITPYIPKGVSLNDLAVEKVSPLLWVLGLLL